MNFLWQSNQFIKNIAVLFITRSLDQQEITSPCKQIFSTEVSKQILLDVLDVAVLSRGKVQSASHS